MEALNFHSICFSIAFLDGHLFHEVVTYLWTRRASGPYCENFWTSSAQSRGFSKSVFFVSFGQTGGKELTGHDAHTCPREERNVLNTCTWGRLQWKAGTIMILLEKKTTKKFLHSRNFCKTTFYLCSPINNVLSPWTEILNSLFELHKEITLTTENRIQLHFLNPFQEEVYFSTIINKLFFVISNGKN